MGYLELFFNLHYKIYQKKAYIITGPNPPQKQNIKEKGTFTGRDGKKKKENGKKQSNAQSY